MSLTQRIHVKLFSSFSVIRGELGAWWNQSNPHASSQAPSAWSHISWQGNDVAEHIQVDRDCLHSINLAELYIMASYMCHRPTQMHLAGSWHSQSDENRGRRGSAAQRRCSRTMSPKGKTVSSFIKRIILTIVVIKRILTRCDYVLVKR